MVNDQRGLARLSLVINEHLKELEQLVSESASHKQLTFPPNQLTLRGYGSILHDFYTGIEHILLTITDEIDGSSPTSSDWHRQLLSQVASEFPDVRPPVISVELREMLDPYRGFRHVFRNVYGHRLDWKRMVPLLDELPATYALLKDEITAFLNAMKQIIE